MSFPDNFVWGVAAASYQIEGGACDDGKGLSVWDVFCRKEGAISYGHTGEVACDHYHRYRDRCSALSWLDNAICASGLRYGCMDMAVQGY